MNNESTKNDKNVLIGIMFQLILISLTITFPIIFIYQLKLVVIVFPFALLALSLYLAFQLLKHKNYFSAYTKLKKIGYILLLIVTVPILLYSAINSASIIYEIWLS